MFKSFLQRALENLVQLIDYIIFLSSGPQWEFIREIVSKAHLYKRIRSPKGPEVPGSVEEYELDYFEDWDMTLYDVKLVVLPDNIEKYVPFAF